MKKFVIASLAAVSVLFASSLACAADTTKPVKIKHNAEIHFAYYDVKKSELVVLSAKPDKNGVITFNVPLIDKDGPSYSFFFRMSKEDMDKDKANLEKIRFFRIPEGESHLTLRITDPNNLGITNEEGAIQIWGYK
jgi:hypothetical protein